jgi:hypothetical protein
MDEDQAVGVLSIIHWRHSKPPGISSHTKHSIWTVTFNAAEVFEPCFQEAREISADENREIVWHGKTQLARMSMLSNRV